MILIGSFLAMFSVILPQAMFAQGTFDFTKEPPATGTATGTTGNINLAPGDIFGTGTGTTTAGTATAGATTASSGTVLPNYCKNLPATLTTLSAVFQYLTCFIQRSILPLLFTIAGLVFIWGAVKFMGADESAEKEEGRQFMLWGIIALVIMFSVWGLVNMLGITFGIQNVFPKIPVNPPGTIQ